MAAAISLRQADKISGFLRHLEGPEFTAWEFNDDRTIIKARDVEGDVYEITFIPNPLKGGQANV